MARKDKEEERKYQAEYYQKHKGERKTHTSSEVKNRYKQKTYTRLTLEVRKEKAELYKQKCKEKNIPYSQPLHNAIEKFLEEN